MSVSASRSHEERAISEVRERLQAKFSERDPAEVAGVVDRVARNFTAARIRDYVPVLVERISRDAIDSRPALVDKSKAAHRR